MILALYVAVVVGEVQVQHSLDGAHFEPAGSIVLSGEITVSVPSSSSGSIDVGLPPIGADLRPAPTSRLLHLLCHPRRLAVLAAPRSTQTPMHWPCPSSRRPCAS